MCSTITSPLQMTGLPDAIKMAYIHGEAADYLAPEIVLREELTLIAARRLLCGTAADGHRSHSRSKQISVLQGPEETLGPRFAVLGERPGCTSKPGWTCYLKSPPWNQASSAFPSGHTSSRNSNQSDCTSNTPYFSFDHLMSNAIFLILSNIWDQAFVNYKRKNFLKQNNCYCISCKCWLINKIHKGKKEERIKVKRKVA